MALDITTSLLKSTMINLLNTLMLHVPECYAEFQSSCNSSINHDSWCQRLSFRTCPLDSCFVQYDIIKHFSIPNLLPDFQSLAHWNGKEWDGISCPRSSNLNSENVR
jgi:hypothetical protein